MHHSLPPRPYLFFFLQALPSSPPTRSTRLSWSAKTHHTGRGRDKKNKPHVPPTHQTRCISPHAAAVNRKSSSHAQLHSFRAEPPILGHIDPQQTRETPYINEVVASQMTTAPPSTGTQDNRLRLSPLGLAFICYIPYVHVSYEPPGCNTHSRLLGYLLGEVVAGIFTW